VETALIYALWRHALNIFRKPIRASRQHSMNAESWVFSVVIIQLLINWSLIMAANTKMLSGAILRPRLSRCDSEPKWRRLSREMTASTITTHCTVWWWVQMTANVLKDSLRVREQSQSSWTHLNRRSKVSSKWSRVSTRRDNWPGLNGSSYKSSGWRSNLTKKTDGNTCSDSCKMPQARTLPVSASQLIFRLF